MSQPIRSIVVQNGYSADRSNEQEDRRVEIQLDDNHHLKTGVGTIHFYKPTVDVFQRLLRRLRPHEIRRIRRFPVNSLVFGDRLVCENTDLEAWQTVADYCLVDHRTMHQLQQTLHVQQIEPGYVRLDVNPPPEELPTLTAMRKRHKALGIQTAEEKAKDKRLREEERKKRPV